MFIRLQILVGSLQQLVKRT